VGFEPSDRPRLGCVLVERCSDDDSKPCRINLGVEGGPRRGFRCIMSYAPSS